MDTRHSIHEETNQLKPTTQTSTPAEALEFEAQIIVPAGSDFLLCYASAEGRFF